MKGRACFFISSRIHSFVAIFLLSVISVGLSGCGGDGYGDKFSIIEAEWDADDSTLKIEGKGDLDTDDLTVSDADSGVALSGLEIEDKCLKVFYILKNFGIILLRQE